MCLQAVELSPILRCIGADRDAIGKIFNSHKNSAVKRLAKFAVVTESGGFEIESPH